MKRLLLFLALFPWVVLLLWPITRPLLLRGVWVTFPVRGTTSVPFLAPDDSESEDSNSVRQAQANLPDLQQAIGATLASPSTFEHVLAPHSIAEALSYRDDFAPLLKRDPNNLTLLALRLQSDFLLSPSNSQSGPLFSTSPAWSVAITPDAHQYLFPGTDFARQPTVSSGDWTLLQPYLQTARKGQRLEPDNAYWDWMLLQALCLMNRQSEFESVLKGVRHKTRYHDYFQERLRAQAAWQEQWHAPLLASERLKNWFELEGMTSGTVSESYGNPVQKWAAQLVMGARLRHQNQLALDLGLGMVHLGRLMRLGAFTLEVSEQGENIEQYALSMARLDAIKRPAFLAIAPFPKPAIGDLVGYAPALPALATTQQQPGAAKFCFNQWDNCVRWTLPTLEAALPVPIMRKIGVFSRLVLGVGASLWALALVGACCHRKNEVIAPNLWVLAQGIFWTTLGWVSAIGVTLFNPHDSSYLFYITTLSSQWLEIHLPLNFFPVTMALLGAAVTARWRQWHRNRSAELEKPLAQQMAWSFEKVHDLRPLVFLCLRGIIVGLILVIAVTGPLLSLSADWRQLTMATSRWEQLFDWLASLSIFSPPVDAFAAPLLTAFLFVALCFKPEARRARHEMRLLWRDYSLGAFIAGSWIVLVAFIFWMRAESDFTPAFAPLENGQLVKISAQKAGLKWD